MFITAVRKLRIGNFSQSLATKRQDSVYKRIQAYTSLASPTSGAPKSSGTCWINGHIPKPDKLEDSSVCPGQFIFVLERARYAPPLSLTFAELLTVAVCSQRNLHGKSVFYHRSPNIFKAGRNGSICCCFTESVRSKDAVAVNLPVIAVLDPS